MARLGMARQGAAGLGLAWRGMARRGLASPGMARRGMAWHIFSGGVELMQIHMRRRGHGRPWFGPAGRGAV
jgi:hypothetical protein